MQLRVFLILAFVLSVARAQPIAAGYWHTSGTSIVDQTGQPVRIAGISWFGAETTTFAPHGLSVRSYRSILDQILSLGYNTIRLPYCNQLFDSGSTPNGIDFTLNPDLAGLSGIQILDQIVNYSGQIGLRIILDQHRPNDTAQSLLWYTDAYPESRWISDWAMLTTRYNNNPTVVGVDLHNEPGGTACWGCGDMTVDWAAAATRAGNAVLNINPNLLIVVQGIQNYNGDYYWNGGNLEGVASAPITLTVPNQVVYAAHDYPASVYNQPWFSDPTYPANLPSVWTTHWGFIQTNGIAPVMVGEFGSSLNTTSDQQWFSAIVNYLSSGGYSWLFWDLNPDSTDTGGLLLSDWTTVDTRKQTPLATIQAPLVSLGSVVAPSIGVCQVTYKVVQDWGSGFAATVSIVNNSGAPFSSWTVTWSFPGNQVVTEVYNASLVNNVGFAGIAVQSMDYNAKVPQGASLSFGLTGSYTNSNPVPTNFAVNNLTCVVGN